MRNNRRLQHVEELKSFLLVSNKRVDLCIATEADTFAEVVHVAKMLNPLTVDDLAHDLALNLTHLVGAHVRLARFKGIHSRFVQDVSEFATVLAVEAFDVQLVIDREDFAQWCEDAIDVVVVHRNTFRNPCGDRAIDCISKVAQNRLAEVSTFEDLLTLGVNHLALYVHHIVIFENVLTCIEVVLLDLLLCIFNHLGEDWHVNRLVIFPLLHQDGVGAVTKCTPEEVFEGDMEAARTWVALTSGTSSKLIVDAARKTQTSPKDFFQEIASASAYMSRDPSALRKGGNLADGGILGEYLEGLPYRSKSLNMTQDLWLSLSVAEQQDFIDELDSKIRLYETFHNDVANWVRFGDAEPGDGLYRVPLSTLP